MNIPAAGADLDFLALGALIHRLDPGVIPFRTATNFDVHVSGGEYNCAANLSACFGLKTGVATAMVDNGIGELIQREVRAMGVRPFYKEFKHDGVRGPNMATVYSDRGQGVRPPIVFYNRANEAGAMLKPGDFDWDKIFSGGIRWVHSGGIFAALSETTSQVVVEMMEAAGRHGAIRSFDLNYRAKLWDTIGGAAKGQEMMAKIVKNVDVIVGNEEDLQKGCGIKGPDVEEKASSALDPANFFKMIGNAIEKFPNLKVIGTTLREVHSTNRHSWSAVLWHEGKEYVAPRAELDVIDRIGGGDGFASGVIYGLLDGRSPEETLKLGWAHGALLTTFPGDVSRASLAEVEAFAQGGSARVQR